MRKDSRLLAGLAALLLIPAFFLPLWSIRIVAPQYNDGLGMFIGLRDIWGHSEHDIQNINILNHYIGMKPIDPAIVDVLTIMPWVVGFLIVAALLVAAIGRRWLVAAWLIAFAVLGTLGLYEFYSWNYDYGNNLDPKAPIKIPGMSYQPPLIGTKQLLNMTTTSLPTWGTLFIALSFVAGVLALVNERWPLLGARRTRDDAATTGASASATTRGTTGGTTATGLSTTAAAIAALLLISGCGPRQAEAEMARESASFPAGQPCAYCEGTVPEARFGGELVTTGGETYHFKAVECLAGFLLEQRVPAEQIATVRVVDYGHGERLLDAESAYYVRMQFEKSPGGLSLAAVATDKVAGTLHYFHGGERMSWEQVLEYVRSEWEL